MEVQGQDYLGANKDWADFCDTISHNTGVMNKDLWLKNAQENRSLIKECGWVCEDMQDAHMGKTAVILGASPAIKTQLEVLRNLQEDPDFVLCGITSGIGLMLNNGIRPKYCMMADADPAQVRFYEGLDMKLTKDTTLIASISCPKVIIDMWEGPKKFIAVYSDEKKLDRKVKKWFKNINGCNGYFHAIFSQYNTITALAYLVFGCNIMIFVGNELSFKDNEATYYPDRKDPKDAWIRKPHPDIYGRTVYTGYMLMSLKLALEDYLGKLPGVFFNCTEAGIFGVSARYGNVPWIHQIKLNMGIAQARSIMKTGKPIYLN
jgi:hypothetical protein